MDMLDTWSDETMVTNLENISKKFASPEAPLFTKEEFLVIQQLNRRSDTLSPGIMQFFMGSDPQLTP